MAYKVLIVDDSPVTRIMIREMLETLGHQVVGEADSGRGGIDAFRSLKPDLLTLDVSLPDMDGLQVLRELRLKNPLVRVVMVTGNDQKKVLEQAKAMKAGFVAKPFSVQDLANALALAMGAAPPHP
ncbi:MAG TPA: two-component system response regulator [Elusimicrobia bacterium]|nr:two-component system response regulator [Elusimicrobiota bacterium]